MVDADTEIATLRALLAASGARADAMAAEAAHARAVVSGGEPLIAHLRLEIEKLRRALYGHRSERREPLLDQLELHLEELEAAASEDEALAEAAAAKAATEVAAFDRRTAARADRGACHGGRAAPRRRHPRAVARKGKDEDGAAMDLCARRAPHPPPICLGSAPGGRNVDGRCLPKHAVSSTTFYKFKARWGAGGVGYAAAEGARMSRQENGDARCEAGGGGAGLGDPRGEPARGVPGAGGGSVQRALSQGSPGRRRGANRDEGRGGRAAAIRLPAHPCHAGAAGDRDEPQEAEAALSRGAAPGAAARRAQAGARHASADAGAGRSEHALEPRLSDALAYGRRIRVLAVVDDYGRERLALVACTSLSGHRVVRELDTVITRRGKPASRSAPTSYVGRSRGSGGERSLRAEAFRRGFQRDPSGFRRQGSGLDHSKPGVRPSGPDRPQHEIQIQAEDPNIIYGIARRPDGSVREGSSRLAPPLRRREGGRRRV